MLSLRTFLEVEERAIQVLVLMKDQSNYLIFAQCAPGLEKLLEAELVGLGFSPSGLTGGVEFRGGMSAVWRVCLASRLSESVRIRLKKFVVRGFSALERELRKLPFRAFLDVGTPVRVRVVCHKSRLWHSGAVQERVEGVLRDHVGFVISEDQESAHMIHVRLQDDEVQVSLDVGGERMHRRGYREHAVQASMRETLAAALVRAALNASKIKTGGELVIWDPFCGAGTIALEAAHFALGRVAGERRKHSFENFRAHDAQEYADFVQALTTELGSLAPFSRVQIWASDKSEKALQAARHNAENATLMDSISFREGDILSVLSEIPAGALIVANPPYGKRIQDNDAIKKLRQALGQRKDLGPAVLLVGGSAQKVLPSVCPALFRTKNGGLSVSARLVRA